MVKELDHLLREFIFRPDKGRFRMGEILREYIQDGNGIDKQSKCRDVIVNIVQNHKKYRKNRGRECPAGHPILHAAMSLAFEYSLDDSHVISGLLSEVYRCEKTFEGVFAGAIFGRGASYLITGRKSEISGAEAVEYFLRHATKSRLKFDSRRFCDVVMKNVGLTPFQASQQIQNLEMISVLVKFGAGADTHHSVPPSLLLLCKLKIREILHSNWELPFGLGKLPLPDALISYVQAIDAELIHALLPAR